MAPPGWTYLHFVLDVVPNAQHHNPEHRLRPTQKAHYTSGNSYISGTLHIKIETTADLTSTSHRYT